MLLIFSLLRLTFYLHNQSLFPISHPAEALNIFTQGLRFDLSALCYINLLLILSYLLPLSYRSKNWYQKLQRWIFVSCNGLAIFFEIVDIAYFPFVLRRSNIGDLALANNTHDLVPLFLREYWYLILLVAGLLIFLNYSFKKWRLPYSSDKQNLPGQLLIMVLGGCLFFLAIRGGTQLKPLHPMNAQQYAPDMQLAPLVYPTSLSLIFSIQQKTITEQHYFSEEEVQRLFPIYKKGKDSTPLLPQSKTNVIIIILESFGQEYSGFLSKDQNGYTTFMDSLMQEGYYFEKSFANGLRSTQGIAAISASIPALMEDPYLFSAYQSNQIDGLAQLLKNEGYTSGFFHGANPGSMGFENFAQSCGFDYYFDRRHFNDDRFYDGHWGIWDRPFFQYTIDVLDTFPEPFHAQLFSMSSHHPYRVEPFYEALQPKSMPMYRSIRYTDDALRRFFRKAREKSWFENTLFVITADHIGFSRVYHYQTSAGRYLIPLFLYTPNSDLKGVQKGVAQQVDILPTVLDYLNYNKSFTSFGNSMLDTVNQRYAYMYYNQTYQIIDERFILLFDGEKTTGMYEHIHNYWMKEELMDDFPADRIRLEKQLKAVIQQHHNRLIRNELKPKPN